MMKPGDIVIVVASAGWVFVAARAVPRAWTREGITR